MNSHQPTPNVQPSEDMNALNDRIMKTLGKHRWKGRLITGAVLFFSVFSLIFTCFVFSMAYYTERNFRHSSRPAHVDPANPSVARFWAALVQPNPSFNGTEEAKPTYSDMRQIFDAQLNANSELSFHINMINTIGIAMTLLGLCTLSTLLLVIFNRRIALRQINESLAQISAQLHEMQRGPPQGAA
jgi:magnesium-transporting ATPase (P-type)